MSADARRGLAAWRLPAEALGQLGRVKVEEGAARRVVLAEPGRFHMRKGEAFRLMSKHRLKGDHRLMSAPRPLTPAAWVHEPRVVRHGFSKVTNT